jgi:F-type H+-transporting ATPase subunit b
MQQLVHQLGLDWKLLLSQAVNFLLVLIILRIFVYKPILKIMKSRRMKIEEGLEKAEAADHRLTEINEIAKSKIKEAEQEALGILRQTETRAKVVETNMLEAARKKESELLENTELIIKGKEKEAEQMFYKKAAEVVKAAVVKTVELSPEEIDAALVEKALKGIKQTG